MPVEYFVFPCRMMEKVLAEHGRPRGATAVVDLGPDKDNESDSNNRVGDVNFDRNFASIAGADSRSSGKSNARWHGCAHSQAESKAIAQAENRAERVG